MEPQISPAALEIHTHTQFLTYTNDIYIICIANNFQSDKFIENWFINFIFEIIIIQHTTV